MKKIISGVIIIIALAFIFWYGGDAPGVRSPEQKSKTVVDAPVETPRPTATIEPTRMPVEESKPQNTPVPTAKIEDLAKTDAPVKATDKKTVRDIYMTDTIPEGKPLPLEPQAAIISDKKYTCTLAVKCGTILNNISWLDAEKIKLVPEDGIIFAEREVEFYEGESVFNLLIREMKQNRIHMEFENVPIYNSAYIEGIANLYEFDCGELSGWIYKVNDWFPNYGCSRYQLKPGDKVEWVYTCDLGVDVGGYYASKGK